MRNRVPIAAIGLLAGLLPAACSPPSIVGPPGPRSYQFGYVDGCNAGYNTAGSPVFVFNRIERAEAPSTEEPYRSGWQQGYLVCQRSYGRMQNTLYTILGPM